VEQKIAVLNWRQRIMSGVQSVMATYYDMVFGLADLKVREDAVAADTKLVQQNQRRLEVGFMSPFDVQQARAQVSLDEEQLLVAKNFFMERQFALKRLVMDEFQRDDPRIFMPAATPALPVPKINRSAFLAEAFARRYDYQEALLQAEAQDIRLRFARNQALPQLDLVGTYSLNGLSDSFGRSFDQAVQGRTPEWTIGVNLRVPLGNVQGRANLDIAKAQKEQAIIRIKQVELTVGVDVDTVISRIETNRQRLDTAHNTRALNEEAVRIAYRRLEEGQISSFDVIEQQRRLYDARSRELAAQAELNKAITQLWLVTGRSWRRPGSRLERRRRGSDLGRD
jgi:outer membrane protein TolC